jgi:hypothetical protein
MLILAENLIRKISLQFLSLQGPVIRVKSRGILRVETGALIAVSLLIAF